MKTKNISLLKIDADNKQINKTKQKRANDRQYFNNNNNNIISKSSKNTTTTTTTTTSKN